MYQQPEYPPELESIEKLNKEKWSQNLIHDVHYKREQDTLENNKNLKRKNEDRHYVVSLKNQIEEDKIRNHINKLNKISEEQEEYNKYLYKKEEESRRVNENKKNDKNYLSLDINNDQNLYNVKQQIVRLSDKVNFNTKKYEEYQKNLNMYNNQGRLNNSEQGQSTSLNMSPERGSQLNKNLSNSPLDWYKQDFHRYQRNPLFTNSTASPNTYDPINNLIRNSNSQKIFSNSPVQNYNALSNGMSNQVNMRDRSPIDYENKLSRSMNLNNNHSGNLNLNHNNNQYENLNHSNNYNYDRPPVNLQHQYMHDHHQFKNVRNEVSRYNLMNSPNVTKDIQAREREKQNEERYNELENLKMTERQLKEHKLFQQKNMKDVLEYQISQKYLPPSSQGHGKQKAQDDHAYVYNNHAYSVNPYTTKSYLIGNTQLSRNPVIYPVPDYRHNKYLVPENNGHRRLSSLGNNIIG